MRPEDVELVLWSFATVGVFVMAFMMGWRAGKPRR